MLMHYHVKGDPKGLPRFVSQTSSRAAVKRPTFGYMNVMVEGIEPMIFIAPEVIKKDANITIEVLQRSLKMVFVLIVCVVSTVCVDLYVV